MFALIALLTVALSANAVLKEKDLNQTIKVLRAELENSHKEQKQRMALYNRRVEIQHRNMIEIMQRCHQISLMLYSQKEDYTFDLSYACHEATEQYREFKRSRMPYDKIILRLQGEINRYKSLIDALESLPPRIGKKDFAPKDSLDSAKVAHSIARFSQTQDGTSLFILSDESQKYRDVCITLASSMLSNLQKMKDGIEKDQQHYEMIGKRLKRINDYAVKRYTDIQKNIFVNGGDSYFTVLKRFNLSFNEAKNDAEDKYQLKSIKTADGIKINVHSQWRGPIVLFLVVFILFYLVVAAAIGGAIIKWLVPKRFRTDTFMKKRVCIMLVAAIVIFALVLSVVRLSMGHHNFMLMASGLLIELAWLMGVILMSLLIRLTGDQIKRGFRIYTPIMLMGFIIITFRIIFIPNNLVNLIFPPILIAVTIWQWFITSRCKGKIPKSDQIYTWISLIIMMVSTIASWAGYTLMAVQILIWWLFQLTSIQTITCLFDLLGIYEARYLIKKIKGLVRIDPKNKKARVSKDDVMKATEKLKTNKGAYIDKTWFFDFVSMALVPILGVMSIMWSILWSADIFDLTDSIIEVFFINFLNIPNIISLSLQKIVTAMSLWFLFHYIAYLLRSLYKRYRKQHTASGNKPNFALANNLISIVVWGAYVIICMMMLHIPAGAIETISTGLAAGLGFAMKDLLENFFYGISLMSGRVRVGDFIECDGVRGKVESITYQSTQITTLDGSIIAFLNSALFNKNFTNLTKNNSYEFVKVPVGVAYGTNVDRVRDMLIKSVSKLQQKNKEGRDIISTKRPMGVVLDEFGDNSINLFFTYWVMVEEKFSMTSRVKETIYNTLNDNNIEIPFPQRDVYIKQAPVSVPKQHKPRCDNRKQSDNEKQK